MAKLTGKELQQFLAKAKVRSKDDLPTIDIEELFDFFNGDQLDLMTGREGTEYVKLTFGDQSLNLSIGQSVRLTKRGDARLSELLENYVLYAGTKVRDDKGNLVERDFPWFSFGADGSSSANIVGSMKLGNDVEPPPTPAPRRRRVS